MQSLLANFGFRLYCRITTWPPQKKKHPASSCVQYLSAKFALFWFWSLPITKLEADIQKWLWPGLLRASYSCVLCAAIFSWYAFHMQGISCIAVVNDFQCYLQKGTHLELSRNIWQVVSDEPQLISWNVNTRWHKTFCFIVALPLSVIY